MQGGVGGGRREASPYPDPAVHCWEEESERIEFVKRTAEIVAVEYLFLSVVRFTDFRLARSPSQR
jgi:hypothetical protein